MQVPQYALALAPSKVPTLTQLPGRENSRTAETNKIFPKRPRTCVGWHRDPRVEHTRWMPHSQIQQNQPHFGGGGGLFLILLSSLSDNCRSPSKGRVQDTPAVHCGWWSPRHARRWSRWRSHQMAPAALVVWLAVSVVAFRSGLATTPKST